MIFDKVISYLLDFCGLSLVFVVAPINDSLGYISELATAVHLNASISNGLSWNLPFQRNIIFSFVQVDVDFVYKSKMKWENKINVHNRVNKITFFQRNFGIYFSLFFFNF